MTRLGDILDRNRSPVAIRDDETYTQVTVRTNHNGVVPRGQKRGSEIGTKNQCRVSPGQFLLSRIDARHAAFGMVPEELDGAVVTNDFLAFDIREDRVERGFFDALLKSPVFLEACVKASRGNTNRKRVDEAFFLDYEVSLPPLKEQRRLLKRIERGQAVVASVEAEIIRQRKLLTRLRQSILDEAVRGRLTASWRIEHPVDEPAPALLARIATERARLVKEKKLRKTKPLPPLAPDEQPFDLPDGWVWCRINDLGVVIGGMTKNATKRAGHKVEMPYLRVANVYADRLDLTEVKTIGVADSELNKLLLEKDDLLVVEGNGSKDQVGRVARWDGSIDPCLHQNHVIKVRLGETRMADWALWWCLSPAGRLLIEEQARTSTGLYNLSVGKVANLPMPVPPLGEQAAIATRVASLLSTCDTLDREITRSAAHSSSLLSAVLREAFMPTTSRSLG